MTTATSTRGELVRTIRLDDTRLEAILDRLDNPADKPDNHRRTTERYRYRMKACVVHLQQPGDGAPTPYLVPTRDISAGGLGFLHGGFVHIGSKCLVQLISSHGAWQDVRGLVVRCRYVGDGAHEVGIAFKSEIDPACFANQAACFNVLLMESDTSTARLADFLLGQLNAKVDRAANGQAATEMARQGKYGLILIDVDPPAVDGLGVAGELRRQSYSGRIVAMTSATGPADRERCLEAGCDNYLAKPLAREQLSGLLDSLRQASLVSSFQTDSATAPVIGEFLAEVPARLRAIEEAHAAGDTERLASLTRALRGEGSGYGFEPITEAAAELEAALAKSLPPDQVAQKLEALVNCCLRARSSAKVTKPHQVEPDSEAGPQAAETADQPVGHEEVPKVQEQAQA